jgi:hypothetical protein
MFLVKGSKNSEQGKNKGVKTVRAIRKQNEMHNTTYISYSADIQSLYELL